MTQVAPNPIHRVAAMGTYHESLSNGAFPANGDFPAGEIRCHKVQAAADQEIVSLEHTVGDSTHVSSQTAIGGCQGRISELRAPSVVLGLDVLELQSKRGSSAVAKAFDIFISFPSLRASMRWLRLVWLRAQVLAGVRHHMVAGVHLCGAADLTGAISPGAAVPTAQRSRTAALVQHSCLAPVDSSTDGSWPEAERTQASAPAGAAKKRPGAAGDIRFARSC